METWYVDAGQVFEDCRTAKIAIVNPHTKEQIIQTIDVPRRGDYEQQIAFAEAKAILEGMKLLAGRGVEFAAILNDHAGVVHKIRNPDTENPDLHLAERTLRKCIDKAGRRPGWKVLWTRREGNAAHEGTQKPSCW